MGTPEHPPRRQVAPSGGQTRYWLLLLAVMLLAAVALHQGWHQQLSLERLAANEQALRELVAAYPLAAVAGYAGIYIAAITLSLPGGLALTLAGGFLFGWLTAGLVTVLAATVGASLLFQIARSTFGEVVAARAGPRVAAFREGFRRDALSYLLFLRLVPAFPFWLVNLAPALLGVRLSTFVLATFVGIIPGTFAVAVVGSGLGSVIAAQRQAYQACLARAPMPDACSFTVEVPALLTPGVIAALVALGVLALVPVGARKWMAWRGMAGDP